MKHGLLAIGEVMAEIRTDGEVGFALGFAGDSYNTAVYAAREIPAPGAVAYLTRVGSEPLSIFLDKIFFFFRGINFLKADLQ